MNLEALAVLALAAWRLATFLVNEEGPFLIARRIREGAGIMHDSSGEPFGVPDTTLAGILGCVWCCSFWTGALMLALWRWEPIVVEGFAVAGAAVVIEVTVGRLRNGNRTH